MNRSSLRIPAALAALALVLVGCTPADGLDRVPQAQGTELPAADTSDWLMPVHLDDQPVYDPGWITEPQELDGIFLAPREVAGVLEFIAVDSSGRILWSAERPISCTGFVLTQTNEGRPLAILSDVSTTDDALAATTASAYDLNTGALVWGPVQVPGPHHGPGLVYAAPPPGPMGATGKKVALDSETGEVAAAEVDGSARIVGEYDGMVLRATNTQLEASESHSGSIAWRVSAEELGADPAHLRAAVQDSNSRAHTMLQSSPQSQALLELEHGRVLASGVRQAHTDAVTGIHLLLADDELRALDSQGDTLWQLSADGQTTIAGPGDALVFLQSGGSVRVHNIASGNIVRGYPATGTGVIILPVIQSGSEAAIVTDHSRYYLVGDPAP